MAVAERGFEIFQRADAPAVRNPYVELADYTVAAGAPFSVTLPSGLFNDPDNDAAALSARVYFERVIDDPEPGVPDRVDRGWEPLPAWMNLDPVSGELTGTPPANVVGLSFTLRVSASEVNGETTSPLGTDYDPLYDFRVTVRPPATGVPFQSVRQRLLEIGPGRNYFNFAFSNSQVFDPEGGTVRFDRVELLRRVGLDYVPYDPRPEGGSIISQISGFSRTNGYAYGSVTQEGDYLLEAVGFDPQGNEVRVTRSLRFVNADPVARPFSAVVTAGTDFDLALLTFNDPDPTWANPPVFSTSDPLPPGVTLTPSGRLQGRIEEVGGTVSAWVTITDSLTGRSSGASIFIRAEAEGGPLSPRVNTEWTFLPGAAQVGEIAGPYRLVERRYIPGRAESTFGPAIPARWESVAAPAWITVDPTTGRLEGTPPTAGRIVLAYEVDLPGEGDSVNTLVLSSFTLNVREDLVVNPDGPAAGPPLGTTIATEGRYFRWVMPSANLAGATSIRLDRVQSLGADETWTDAPEAMSWLRWNDTFRRLEGTPPNDGRYRLVFVGQLGDAPTEIALELDARPAQSASTGSVSWPEPGLGDGRFESVPLTLHGGLNLSAYTAMGSGPAQTIRAGVARTTPVAVAPPAGKLNLETLWFTYDGLNRVVIHQGALNNGTIELVESEYGSARQSHQNVYDTAGRLVAQSGLASRFVYRPNATPERVVTLETRYFVHDLRGNVVAEGNAASLLGTPLLQLPNIEANNRSYGMDDRTAYFAALRDLVPEATTLRRYDDLGRLVEERELYATGSIENAIAAEAEKPRNPGEQEKDTRVRTTIDISGWLKQASSFTYDADGRMLTQSAFRRDETTRQETVRLLNGNFSTYDTGVKAWVEAAYNEMQRNPDFSWQVTQRYQLQTSTLSESTVTNFTSAAPTAARYDWRGRLLSAATPALGYDAAGVLRGYTVQEISGGTVRWTDTYSYEYSLQDGYLETKVAGTSSDRNRRASETLSSYDGWGRRTSLEERTNLKREFDTVLRSARYFAYDAEGGLISRREGELVEEKDRPLQFRQARKEDAKFKNLNPVPHLVKQAEWDAMTASQREYWAGAANTHRYSFANGQLLGSVSEAGRISVGDRLTGFENSSLGTSTVVVRSGETLRSIAQRVYGDGSLWYVLADANGLTNSDETLAEGQNLQVPQVGTNTNSASTFKPYDPSEQIGPTAPSLPTIAPPPKNSCNPIAQLLMVIVAVVVTIYTAGAAAGAMTSGAVTTGATGATVAAGASTMQIGAAVLAGSAGGIGTATMIGAAAIGGAVGSIASQAVGIATGQQQGFSWRGVAAGALSAGFTAGIGNIVGTVGGAVQGAMNGTGSWLNVAKVAGAHALGGAAAGVLSGGSFSWRSVAANAVGSVASATTTNAMFGTVQLPGGTGSILSDTATGFVGGIVSAHTRKAFGVGGVNEGRIALDAFGNALGNALIPPGGANKALTSSLGDPGRIGNGLASLNGPAVDDPFGGYGKAGGLLGVDSLNAPDGGWSLDAMRISRMARSGDTIWGMLGDDASARGVEAFIRLNGLRNSTIRDGNEYMLPTDSEIAAAPGRFGKAVLDADNLRVAAHAARSTSSALAGALSADDPFGNRWLFETLSDDARRSDINAAQRVTDRQARDALRMEELERREAPQRAAMLHETDPQRFFTGVFIDKPTDAIVGTKTTARAKSAIIPWSVQHWIPVENEHQLYVTNNGTDYLRYIPSLRTGYGWDARYNLLDPKKWEFSTQGALVGQLSWLAARAQGWLGDAEFRISSRAEIQGEAALSTDGYKASFTARGSVLNTYLRYQTPAFDFFGIATIQPRATIQGDFIALGRQWRTGDSNRPVGVQRWVGGSLAGELNIKWNEQLMRNPIVVQVLSPSFTPTPK